MTSNCTLGVRLGGLLAAGLAVATPTAAQAPLGTFTWQTQPYCNVVVVTATAVGSSFRLEGFDDQCGAPQRAPLSGMATPNPDGTVSFAFVVITGDASGTHISGLLSASTLNGSWIDGGGLTGTLLFGATSPSAGSPRPVPPRPAVFGAVFDTSSIAVAGADGETTILSLPFTVPPGRQADIAAFFNGQLRHVSSTPIGSCFGLMRLDNATIGPILSPTAAAFLLLDGTVETSLSALHTVTASLQGIGANIAPGPHVLYVRATTGGQGCSFGQRSLVVLATFR